MSDNTLKYDKRVWQQWHGGQVVRRWSRKPKIMGSIPIHAFLQRMSSMFSVLLMSHGCWSFTGSNDISYDVLYNLMCLSSLLEWSILVSAKWTVFVFDIRISKIFATKVCRRLSLNGKRSKATTRWNKQEKNLKFHHSGKIVEYPKNIEKWFQRHDVCLLL